MIDLNVEPNFVAAILDSAALLLVTGEKVIELCVFSLLILDSCYCDFKKRKIITKGSADAFLDGVVGDGGGGGGGGEGREVGKTLIQFSGFFLSKSIQ